MDSCVKGKMETETFFFLSLTPPLPLCVGLIPRVPETTLYRTPLKGFGSGNNPFFRLGRTGDVLLRGTRLQRPSVWRSKGSVLCIRRLCYPNLIWSGRTSMVGRLLCKTLGDRSPWVMYGESGPRQFLRYRSSEWVDPSSLLTGVSNDGVFDVRGECQKR